MVVFFCGQGVLVFDGWDGPLLHLEFFFFFFGVALYVISNLLDNCRVEVVLLGGIGGTLVLRVCTDRGHGLMNKSALWILKMTAKDHPDCGFFCGIMRYDVYMK